MPVAAAVVQCGIAFGPVSMLVAGDAALMSGATDRAEIASIIEVYAHSPGMAAVREAFPVLDPHSESVGESLLRYALHLLGRPVETQYRPAHPHPPRRDRRGPDARTDGSSGIGQLVTSLVRKRHIARPRAMTT